jgi:hypothetical protein
MADYTRATNAAFHQDLYGFVGFSGTTILAWIIREA